MGKILLKYMRTNSMTKTRKPFLADSLIFKGKPADKSSGDISDIDAGILIDDKNNLAFRDNYVTKILNKDYITLKEIYTRVKGVFTELDSNGKSQLLFKDETVSRPYSLNEIVRSCTEWRNGRTNGSLWWVGREEIDHSQCANLPRISDKSGKKVLWSIDRFLAEVNGMSKCEDPLDLKGLLIDPQTTLPRWWDVQNLEIVIPPTDTSKALILMSKIAFNCYGITEPVLFRLYDASVGVELARASIVNQNSGNILYPLSLNYFGPLPTREKSGRFSVLSNSYSNSEILECEDCGCNATSCVAGDPYCVTSTGDNVSTVYGEGAHLIKVQFRVNNYDTNHWNRVFGFEMPQSGGVVGEPEYLTNSTIDAVVFDTRTNGRFFRQHGTVKFQRQSEYEVIFENPLDDKYTITLSCNQNINVWYDKKLSIGFTIKSELPFSGSVDWSITVGE